VFLEQPDAEAGGLGVLAAGAVREQRLEGVAQRLQLLAQREQRRVLGMVGGGERWRVLAVDREHLAGDLEQSGAELAGRARTFGDLGQLADQVSPAQLLLQDVEPVVADVAVGGDEPAEVLAQQPLGGFLGAPGVDPAGVTLRDSSGRRRRALSPRTINMSLDLAARSFTDAVKRGLLPNNPASDRDLRLKVTQRKGNFLEADELLALIEAASAIDDPVSPHTLGRAELVRRMRGDNRTWKEIAAELDVAETTAIWLAGRYRREGRASPRRAIVATLGCAGLRNTEVCDLNVGDLDLAHGVIHVRDAKTEAGIRQVHMTPWLHDELLAYRATRPDAEPDEPAFPTRSGARRDLRNINRRVIAPAVRAANALRAERRETPLPGSITAHAFRRTFITLMLEAGAPVPYVQGQVGHEDRTTTLEIYAQVLKRRDRRRHGEAFDALMADAIPSAASIMMRTNSDRSEGREALNLPIVADGSGHRNKRNPNLWPEKIS
jgi:integrase